MQRLENSYRAIPPGSPVRLAKRTSNLFRARAATGTPGLDVSGLTGVLEVDPAARIAEVAGMCTYEDLVAATLPHGLTPLVVPQLKTITLGGAVSGLGIEAASFRNGLPHESVLELDVLTGAGELVTAVPGDELFAGFPNSYGTLGYATRLRIELEPVHSHVGLRHIRFDDLDELCAAIAQIMATRRWDGEDVDYLDGVMFSPTESYLTLGTRIKHDGPGSDYTGEQIYYRSLQQRQRDVLSTHDYLWRWDTDWFWLRSIRGPAPGDPPVLAGPAAAKRCVLEDRGTGEPVRPGEQVRGLAWQAAPGTRHPGCRDPTRAHRGVPALVRPARPHRTRLAVPVTAARRSELAVVPAGAGAGLRQRRVLVQRPGEPRRIRQRHQPGHREPGRRRRRAQIAVFGLLLHPRGVRYPLRRRALRGAQTTLRPRPATP